MCVDSGLLFYCKNNGLYFDLWERACSENESAVYTYFYWESHRIIETLIQKDLWRSSGPTSCSQQDYQQQQMRSTLALLILDLKTSLDGDPITSLNKLSQYYNVQFKPAKPQLVLLRLFMLKLKWFNVPESNTVLDVTGRCWPYPSI